MLRATFFGLEIGKTGLTTAQLGLDVTGHNIANVDTVGYTRQRIISTAYDPFATIGRTMPVNKANIGGGVRVKILDQIRSEYLDRRFRTENTINSYWQTRTQNMRYLESYFDNVNEETSINYSIARFFQAMKTLAEDTVEGAPRTLLQTAGKDLVQQLNTIYDGVIDLQSSQNQAIEVTIGRINRIADEIAELNKAIYGFEITGHIANDLRDKRNILLDELSSIVDIEYREYSDGMGNSKLEVKIGGKVLVDHADAGQLGVREIDNIVDGLDEGKKFQPYWIADAHRTSVDETLDMSVMKGGELKAFFDMRDGDGVGNNPRGIPYYLKMLNDLARALAQEINAIHRQGYTDHPVRGSESGINFFGGLVQRLDANGDPVLDANGDPIFDYTYDANEINAKNISLSEQVKESAYYIACSSTEIIKGADDGEAENLQRGNNENMNKLYALFLLKDIKLVDPTNPTADGVAIGSFDGFATSIRFDVGNTLNFAIKSAENSNALTIAAENQRVSVSGVSLDEEMTNLIRYNHAYNGAARVITAMDEALDRLINGTGRVGL